MGGDKLVMKQLEECKRELEVMESIQDRIVDPYIKLKTIAIEMEILCEKDELRTGRISDLYNTINEISNKIMDLYRRIKLWINDNKKCIEHLEGEIHGAMDKS